jgi:hypothetical protein
VGRWPWRPLHGWRGRSGSTGVGQEVRLDAHWPSNVAPMVASICWLSLGYRTNGFISCSLKDYVPGVGLPGLPTGCIVVTDAPGAVPHASVDILVGTRLDPIADAARVTRMASSLHASETLTCADIFDFSHALAKGSHAVCVDAFWCESTPDVIYCLAHPRDAALVAGTAGVVVTLHVPQSRIESGPQTRTSGIAKLCAVGSRLDFSLRDGTAGRPTRHAGLAT